VLGLPWWSPIQLLTEVSVVWAPKCAETYVRINKRIWICACLCSKQLFCCMMLYPKYIAYIYIYIYILAYAICWQAACQFEYEPIIVDAAAEPGSESNIIPEQQNRLSQWTSYHNGWLYGRVILQQATCWHDFHRGYSRSTTRPTARSVGRTSDEAMETSRSRPGLYDSQTLMESIPLVMTTSAAIADWTPPV